MLSRVAIRSASVRSGFSTGDGRLVERTQRHEVSHGGRVDVCEESHPRRGTGRSGGRDSPNSGTDYGDEGGGFGGFDFGGFGDF
jgi:hypothetical protein